MAQSHKAAHEVVIASTQEETAFHKFVERYWKVAAALAVVLTGAILARSYMGQVNEKKAFAAWDRVREDVSFTGGFFGQVQVNDAAALGPLAEELRGEDPGAWAKALQVRALLDEGDFAKAEVALQELEQGWPEHPLVTQEMRFEEDGPVLPYATFVRSRIAAVQAWEKEHQNLFSNPPLPEGAPRVRLNTSAGPIVVGLYKDRAPKHTENFLKNCREGYYDGILFHRVIANFMIQAGDPNTRDGEPETWGLGGPDYKVEAEITPELRHFKHALAGAKMPGDSDSSGSQFYITTEDRHDLDDQYTVFGMLVEGESTVEEIASGVVIGDRPQDPVRIESTEILE